MQSLGLTLAMTWTLDFQGQILKQPYLSGMGGPIDIEQKGDIHDHDRDLLDDGVLGSTK